MNHHPPSTGSPVSERMHQALRQLLNAHDFAGELGMDPWQFAVEVQGLRLAGLTTSDLRWLVCRRYVEHRLEQMQKGAAERRFHRAANLAITRRSCFILTPAGLELALEHVDGHTGPSPFPAPAAVRNGDPIAQAGPHWDEDTRILYWSGRPVKRYRYDAPNQEYVLRVFQSHDWTRSVEVQLPDDGGGSYKERLHDAIKHLNRSVRPVLRFRQAGTWVMWEQGKQLS
jgi:hypothetical protein